jgi:hypothetical protein
LCCPLGAPSFLRSVHSIHCFCNHNSNPATAGTSSDDSKSLLNYFHIHIYKKPSIIPGTGAAIWPRTNLGSSGHHLPRSSPLLHVSTPFSALLPFFKCILEVVFCEGVQHHLRFYLDHLSCVKMAAFQFYHQSGKQRKVRWVGGDSCVVFG